jgi:DNA-binding HxlR family transcriptional regulator
VRYLLVPSIFMQSAAGPAFLAGCPTRLAVEIISDKWAVLVLFGLSHQPRRHGELVDLIGGISRKVLTQTLRRLQQYGLVERHAEAPRRVQYSLTDLGRTLVEPIEVLTNWARDYGGAIVDFQEAAEAATSARAHAADRSWRLATSPTGHDRRFARQLVGRRLVGWRSTIGDGVSAGPAHVAACRKWFQQPGFRSSWADATAESGT